MISTLPIGLSYRLILYGQKTISKLRWETTIINSLNAQLNKI